MAYRGKIISNKKTGQEIRFLQTSKDTDGALLEMESLFQAHSKEPAPHYHPFQEEDFLVLEGEITVRTKGGLLVLKKGEQLHIPAGEVHSMWNDAPFPARVNWKVRPPMDTEYFLENGVGIANKKSSGEDGMPGIWQVALLARRYAQVFRLARPAFAIQKVVFSVLAPFSRIAGYRSSYKEFVD